MLPTALKLQLALHERLHTGALQNANRTSVCVSNGGRTRRRPTHLGKANLPASGGRCTARAHAVITALER